MVFILTIGIIIIIINIILRINMNGLKRKIFAYYFLLIQLYLIEKLFTLNINIDQCRRQRYSMSNTHVQMIMFKINIRDIIRERFRHSFI